MNRGWIITIVLAIMFGALISGIILNQESYKEITPNDRFFVVSIGESPEINTDNWILKVDGLVDNQINLTYDNITSFPIVSDIVTLKCVDGPQGTANWTGVKLKTILDIAHLKEEAMEVVFFGADGYSSSLTVSDATSPDVILAFEMNGETLPVDHGYPVRLVVPGKYGYKWVKWINHIHVVGFDYKGYWENAGWDDDADVTIISDWWIHSVLLSVAGFLGSLSLLSGFKFSKHVKFGPKLPKMFSSKFHIRTSLIFNLIIISVAVLTIINALDKRGNFPNSNHGILALMVVILCILGAASGYVMKFKKENKYLRTIHLSFNFFGYLLLLGSILTGLIISGII
jgi:hypothetical protein